MDVRQGLCGLVLPEELFEYLKIEGMKWYVLREQVHEEVALLILLFFDLAHIVLVVDLGIEESVQQAKLHEQVKGDVVDLASGPGVDDDEDDDH